jgi:SAM-dependent methyltransferase
MSANAQSLGVGRPSFGSEHGTVGDPLFKRALLKLIPGKRRQVLLGALRGARYHGDSVECPCCRGTFSRFLSHRGRSHAKCPGCGSLERHRVLWLFLERETDLFVGPGALLHLAPEYAFLRRLSERSELDYVTGDFDSPLAAHRLDVMDLPFAAESFDFLLCNHVLEHVSDDRLALAEINRVLKPGGWAILMCPVDQRLVETLEDPTVVTPEERHRVFGQSDHVRLYGRDYPERLAAAGFEVRADPYLDRFDEDTITRLGLRREEDEAFGEEAVFLCTKPDMRGRASL